MRKTLACSFVAAAVATASLAHARGGPSEASAASIMITGSVVLVVSTAPLMAMDSVFNGKVGKVQPAGNKMTDIEVKRQTAGKETVIRVPDSALEGKSVKSGQKAELIADQNGHTLRIEEQPIAYVPGTDSEKLLRSKQIK